MWSIRSNPIILTIVPSGQTVPLSIVNAAQQKIGTGRELNEDLRPRIPTGLQMPRRGSKADSKKEGALEYADWRAEVEEYIKKGYEDNKIKDAMLFSLEGKARRNFRHCDEHGDLSPAEILKRMDMSYNASVDFWDLNAQLCGLKQGAFESPKDYYDCMVDIGVALREYHQDRFQPRELSRIEKECFFAGLRD